MNTCQHCGGAFRRPNHPNQKYCSTACRDAAQSTKAAIACEVCGATIVRSPSQVRQHNFCSPACRSEWQRVSGRMAGQNSVSWRGGHTEYRGPNWIAQQRAALDRDQRTCQDCGATEKLQVHHKRPYQLFADYRQANDLDNLVTLCMRCHTRAEWQYRKANPNESRLWPDVRRIHTCTECGQPFEARGPRATRCDACWQRTCAACGQSFRPRLWHEKNKYCSRKCAGTSK